VIQAWLQWAFLVNHYTHQTVPTQFVEVAGIRFASRRFGAKIVQLHRQTRKQAA